MVQRILFGRKSRKTFQTFLSGVPARDYVFQRTSYEEQIRQAANESKKQILF